MRAAAFYLFIASSMAIAGSALAQSAQSSDAIVDFFANAVDLGTSRGICVGTEQECAEKREAELAKVPTGLDMLINFDLNSADLTPEARNKLSEFARALQDNRLRSHNFVVEGHTDAIGSDTYNTSLSQRRAQSVATFLLANGVDASRLQAVGMGETAPRVTDPYDPINRRVEMRIKIQ